MKDKKHLLLKLLCFTFMLGSTAAGAAACKDKPTEPSIPEGYDKTFTDVGSYYADEGEARYTFELTDSTFTLKLGGQTIGGTYLFNGTTLRLVTTDGTIIEATFVGDTLTLTYNSRQYTFLRNEEYTVTFEMNGGTAQADVKVLNGKKLDKPADPVKVEEGKEYAFIGWYTDATYKEEFSFDAAVRRNVTVYARFVELLSDGEYSVTFNGYADLNTETTGGKLFLDTNANKDKYQLAAKDGAKFLGWWYSSYNDGAMLTAKYEGEEIHENIVLYPIWEDSNKPAVSVTDKKITVTGQATTITVYKLTDGARVKVQDVSPEAPDFTFADKDAGDYVVVVKNGDNVTEAYYANKTLARVCQFEIEEPSVFKFRGVEGAEKYLLKIECGTENHSHESIDLGTNTYYNFADCDMKEGCITFQVTAVAKEGYGNSVSEVFKTERELTTVTNLATDNVNEKLTWTKVQYADYYLISVNDGEAFRWDGTTFDLKGYKKGEYKFSLVAVGKGWNNSVAATTTWTKGSIAAPAKPMIEDGYTVKWNAVAGATGYKLKIDDKTIDVTDAKYTLTAADYEAGKASYEISVCAVDASGESLYSDTLIVKGEMDKILDYDSGILTWNPVLGVEKYEVQLNDGEVTLTNTASANITFTQKGENKLKVRVYGATGEDATWLELNVTTYAVGYNVGASEKKIENKYIAKGDVISLPNTDFNGYVFSGWYTETNGGGKKIAAAYGVSPRLNDEGDLTLYAKWESKQYRVALNAGAYSDTDLSKGGTVAYKQAFTLPVPESNDANRAFAGWYYGSVQVTDQNGDSLRNWSYLISGGVVPELTARWEYILEFEKIEGVDGYAVKRATMGAQFLSEIKIPATYKDKKVVRIAAGAFAENGENITKIILPDTLTELETTAFDSCEKLETIDIYHVDSELEPIYYSADGVVIKNDDITGKTLYFVPLAHKGTDGVFTVPGDVQTIASEVFKEREGIKKICVSANVTTVQASAFYDCEAEEIEFLAAEDGVDEKALFIDDNAFQRCSKLTKLTLPARVNEIKLFSTEEVYNEKAKSWGYAKAAFRYSNKIEEINVTGKVAPGTTQVYSSNDGLLLSADGRTLLYYPSAKKDANGDVVDEVVLPDSVTKIGRLAFFGNEKIKTFNVPERITSIGESAFEGCTKLRTLVFEGKEDNEDLRIERRAFYGCKELTELTLSENVRYVGKFAFGGNSYLTELTVNCTGNVKIEDGAFSWINRDLTTGAITVGRTDLEKLIIGAGLKDVDISAAFDGFTASLEEIEVDSANEYYYQDETNKVIYDKQLDENGNNRPTKILYVPTDFEGEYKVPETVTRIGTNIFARRHGLTKIYISNSVTEIGDQAFAQCGSLKEVEWVGAGVGEIVNPLTIGNKAFWQCKAVETFELPCRVQYVGDHAFDGCKFTTFKFEYGNRQLEFGEQVFSECKNLTEIDLPEGVVALGDGAFIGCKSLTTVKIPSTMTRLGNWAKTGDAEGGNATYAFVSMDLFKKLNGGLSNDPDKECSKLASIEVAAENTRYASKDGLLYGKEGDKLTVLYVCPMAKEGNVTLPATVKEIYKEAFACNTGVTGVTFENADGEGVHSFTIGENALYKAAKLTSFALPSGIEKLEAGLFKGCEGLTEITIPNTVKTIAAGAFDGCVSLKKLTFEEGNDDNALKIEDGKYNSSAKNTTGAFANYTPASSYHGPGTSTSPEKNYSCKALTEVKFPKRLTYLGAYAFAYCTKLKTVDFGADSKLGVIGDGAFKGSALESIKLGADVTKDATTGVTTIKLPANLTEICAEAFDQVKFPAKTEIVIPKNVEDFGNATVLPVTSTGTGNAILGKVFNKTNITKVTFENESKLKQVRESAFYGMTKLTAVDFGDDSKLENIETRAFISDKALTDVRFGENSILKTIAADAFGSCTALETISLPASIEALESNNSYGVFDGCSKLKNVTFETYTEGENRGKSSLRYLGLRTFKGTALASFTFPSTVEVLDVGTLGKELFSGCKNLKEVTLSDTVADITGIFDMCGSIEKLNVPTDDAGNVIGYFSSDGVAVYNKAGTEIVYLLGELPEEYTVKNTVTKLGSGIFAGQARLKKVTIPASVMEIGDQAFYDCISLEEVNFETNGALSTIGAAAFKNCRSLKSIRIPNGVTKLNAYTFYNCRSLTKVQLPEGLTHIGYYLYSGTETLDDDGGFVFAHCENLREINIPESTQWIQNYSFLNCKSLTEVALNAEDKKIGEGAFANCTALKKVTLSSNVKTLPSKLFINCTVLDTVTLYGTENGAPVVDLSLITGYGSLSSKRTSFVLGNSTFKNCTAIKEVILNTSALNVLANSLFDGCTNLTYVNKVKTGGTEEAPEYTSYLPNKLAYLGTYSFRNTSIERVRMPDSLTSLGNSISNASGTDATKMWKTGKDGDEYKCNYESLSGAFDGCTKLTYLDLNNVIRIGMLAFRNCPLTEVAGTEGEEGKIAGALDLSKVQVFGIGAFAGTGLKSVDLSGVWLNKDKYSKTQAKFPMGFGNGDQNSTTLITTTDKEGVFENCKQLKEVKFSATTSGTWDDKSTSASISLGALMFKNCSNLQSVYLPKSVGNLPKSVFYGCTRLENVSFETVTDKSGKEIENNVKSFGDAAFARCENLESIDLSKSPSTSLSSYMFDGCTKLANVKLNTGKVYKIGDYAFRDCVSLSSTDDENKGVKAFDFTEFVTCSDGNMVKPEYFSIGVGAFEGCTGLTEVRFAHIERAEEDCMPGQIRLGTSAFKNCTGLTTVDFSENVVNVDVTITKYKNGKEPEYSYYYNYPLGISVFAGCVNLSTLNISSVDYTTSQEFEDSKKGTKSVYEYFITSIEAKDGFIYQLSKNTIKIDGVEKEVQLKTIVGVLPGYDFESMKGVLTLKEDERIAPGALEGVTGIKKVVLPESLTEIPAKLFQNATYLEEVVISSKTTSIGNYAFDGSGIKKISYTVPVTPEPGTGEGTGTGEGGEAGTGTEGSGASVQAAANEAETETLLESVFPATLTTIGTYAFKGTQLQKVILPATLKVKTGYAVKDGAFSASALKSVVIEGSETKFVNTATGTAGAFANCEQLTDVKFTAEKLTAGSLGQNLFYGCTALSNVTLPAKATEIGKRMFEGCTNLKTITLPATVTTLLDYCFKDSGLTAIDLGKITTIEQNAFDGCVGLTSVTIPSTWTTIPNTLFRGTGLTSIVIPEGVTKIEYEAFNNCEKLTSVTLPTTLTSIGGASFGNCVGLTSVTLPEGLLSLDGFAGCTNLKSINIPSTVTTIEGGAFDNCTSLGKETKFVIPASVKTVDYAFVGWTAEQTIYIENSPLEVYNVWCSDEDDGGFAWLVDVNTYSDENQVVNQSFAKIVWNYKAPAETTGTEGK